MENEFLTFENLYGSALKCSNNVKWKKSTSHYLLNQLRETYKLCNDLKCGTYKERPHKQFKVYEPKEREVLSISFRDRVYQRTLNDLVIYPTMTKSFIYENCACQKGKGTDYARNLIKEKLRNYYRYYGTNAGYIIHIDIKKYYPTMSHKVAEDLLRKKLPPDIFKLVEDMLKMYQGDKGYFAGSQLIQILGISVLDSVDHFIKEKLHCKFYLRYMDDLILIVKENPEFYLEKVEQELLKLEFKLNESKTKIVKIYKGVDFLGFTFSMNENGKVYQCILNSNVKRRRRKISKTYIYQTVKQMEDSYQTWRSYAIKTTNKAKVNKIDKFFNEFVERIKNCGYETISKCS